jgi:putative hydrolase of the HAD superfamily
MRAVVFDFYGTLAETRDWGPSFEEIVADLGYELPSDVRDRWWNDGIDGIEHDEHSHSRDHYVAWQRARMLGMLSEAGVAECHHDEFIARVHEISGHRRLDAYDEAHDVLTELRSSGYQLAVCSNWDWDLLDAIDAASLTDTVDLIVSSAWIGARKPHPRVYTHMVEQLEVAPGEILFVGDTWTCDVVGPRAAGFTPVYLRRPHFGADSTAPTDSEQNGVHRASDLRAVLDLL